MIALLSLAVTLLSAFSSPAYAEQIQPQTLTIHHRFLPLDRSSPLPSFLPRLELALSSPTDVSSGLASTKPNVSAQDVQPLSHQDRLRAVNVGEDGLYQLGLELPNGEWATTSMRACHLLLKPDLRQDVLTLSLDSNHQPIHLSYSIRNIPRDGSCPASSSTASFAVQGFSTSVFLKTPAFAPTPMLSTPPPLDAETGRQAVVVPEKSFIQKYWVYMVIPIVLLIVLPDPDGTPAK